MGSNPIGPTGSARLVAQLAEDGGQPHGPTHVGNGLLDLPAGLLGARDDEVLDHAAAGLEPGTALPHRVEEPVDRHGEPVLDLDVADRARQVAALEPGDLGPVVVELAGSARR